MRRFVLTLSLTALLTLVVAGPAFAGMIACPPSPPPGSTLECSVSNSEPESTLTWVASFAHGSEESGELSTDEEGSGGLAVAIPDDPELAGTEFTIESDTGASYLGLVGAPEESGDVSAQGAEVEDVETADEDTDVEVHSDSAEHEQVSARPAEDSEVALGAGGAATGSSSALLLAVLGGALVLGGGAQLTWVLRR